MRTIFVIAVLSLLLAWGVAAAGELSIRQFPLPAHGILVMAVPDAWDVQVGQPPEGLPPTLKLGPKSGPAFEILVTPLWSKAGTAISRDAASLRAEVASAAKAAQSRTVEKAMGIRKLRGAGGIGYYFSATDRQPEPDEYKYMTQGMLPVGDLVVAFTILTNDGADATVDAALLLMRDLGQKPEGTN